MKQTQKIAQKVLLLAWDILLFTWQVVRRVMLPTRNRKGNVLSSLLTFFVGLLERIVSFEKTILQRPVVFTHKYVKQGLIIAVGFLFLLSSFEWIVGPPADPVGNGSPEMVACAPVMTAARTATPRVARSSAVVSSAGRLAAPSFIPLLYLAGPPLVGKRWLRFRIFRI